MLRAPKTSDFIECERAFGRRVFRRNPAERLTGVRLGLGQDAAGLGDIVVLRSGAGCGFIDGDRIVYD